MALELTKQVEAVVRGAGYFEQYENRLSNYGAFKAYLDQGQELLPKAEIEAIKNAQNARALSLPVLTKQSLSVITANSCSFTGVEQTSAKPVFSSITRGFAIKTFPKVAANNMISSEEEQFAQGVRNGLRSIAENLDTYAAGQLDSNKSTGLVAATGVTGVSITSNAYRFDLANRSKFYTKMPTIMDLNDVYGENLVNIMHTNGRELMLDFEVQGQNNSSNLRGALEGTLPSALGYRHYTSKRITNGLNVTETHFVLPFGSIGLFTFVDSDNRIGITDGVNSRKMYTLNDPIFGIQWGVTAEPICEDLSATYGAGYESCNGTQYRFLANFAFMTAYSSDTTKPIHKFEIMNA